MTFTGRQPRVLRAREQRRDYANQHEKGDPTEKYFLPPSHHAPLFQRNARDRADYCQPDSPNTQSHWNKKQHANHVDQGPGAERLGPDVRKPVDHFKPHEWRRIARIFSIPRYGRITPAVLRWLPWIPALAPAGLVLACLALGGAL